MVVYIKLRIVNKLNGRSKEIVALVNSGAESWDTVVL